MIKLNQDEVKKGAKHWDCKSIEAHQGAVYVMCGGSFLGRFASEQPADFYIDDRVARLPYKKKEIYQAVETLATIAKENGLDPHRLPAIPNFHNSDIF